MSILFHTESSSGEAFWAIGSGTKELPYATSVGEKKNSDFGKAKKITVEILCSSCIIQKVAADVAQLVEQRIRNA